MSRVEQEDIVIIAISTTTVVVQYLCLLVGPAKVMWFEKMYVWLRFFERNVMMPVVFLCAITVSAPKINTKFGPL